MIVSLQSQEKPERKGVSLKHYELLLIIKPSTQKYYFRRVESVDQQEQHDEVDFSDSEPRFKVVGEEIFLSVESLKEAHEELEASELVNTMEAKGILYSKSFFIFISAFFLAGLKVSDSFLFFGWEIQFVNIKLLHDHLDEASHLGKLVSQVNISY